MVSLVIPTHPVLGTIVLFLLVAWVTFAMSLPPSDGELDAIVRTGTTGDLRRRLFFVPKARRQAALRREGAVLACGRNKSWLTEACVMRRWEMAKALIELGLPVDHLVWDGGDPAMLGGLFRPCWFDRKYLPRELTALEEVCLMGREDAVVFLISLGASTQRIREAEESSLVHLACRAGHTELARLLVVRFGLPADCVDWGGRKPLHLACMGGHTGTALEIASAAIAAESAAAAGRPGWAVDKINVPDSFEATPLVHAAVNVNVSAATALAIINICGARINAAGSSGLTPLHFACFMGRAAIVSALLAEGARLDAKDCDGNKPQQVICLRPEADPADKPLVVAAFVRHLRLERLGREVLRLAATWDHDSLKRAMDALMAAAAEPWVCSAAVAHAVKTEFWTVPRHPLDMFREPATGRTALGVAAAAGIFRNAELLIQAAASPLELDCGGRTPWQLALARGSELMAVWFEAMPVVYWAGHSQLRYRVAAGAVVLCCRFSRMRAPGCMHPDDWCIPRRDVYRILHFVGPQLWGSVWPGPPRGFTGLLPSCPPRRPQPSLPVRPGGMQGALPPPLAPFAALRAQLSPRLLVPMAKMHVGTVSVTVPLNNTGAAAYFPPDPPAPRSRLRPRRRRLTPTTLSLT
jgi:ankyrin repeat protein